MDNLPASTAESKELQDDDFGRSACEVANVLGVMVGFGSLPLLRGQFPERLWIAGLAAGALVLAAGLLYAARLRLWRLRSMKPVPSLVEALPLPVLILLVQTVLIGICLLLPALAAFGLRRQAGLEPGLLQIYLSAPAILVWVGGEVLFARPWYYIRPMRTKEVAGLSGRGLQILGALLLWAFLGLSVGVGSITWMAWAAAGLAGVGLLLALSTGAPAPTGASAPTSASTASSSAAGPTASADVSEPVLPAENAQ